MPGSATYSRYPRRVAPSLPSPESLPFPANLVRQCSDCRLCGGCTAPVPGSGAIPAEAMLVGQNPGRNEDLEGRPFIGQAGQYLDSLLFQCGIPRESVYITNQVKCLTANNRTPTPVEIQACSKWLDIELGLVNPRIVVAMGKPAIDRFLGAGAGTVEHLHGKPIEKDGRIILPAYHPAAALHNTTLLRQCQEDFQVLRGLVRGRNWWEYHVEDEYPNPTYRVADTRVLLRQMEDEIADSGEFAVDTEQCHGELWSVQISAKPGTAWFIPVMKSGYKGRVGLTPYNATVVVHHYLHDIQYLDIPDDNFADTMVMSYLVGQAQGLKELASRLCGIRMVDYAEVVHPGQHKLALAYLEKVSERQWPDPPAIEEVKWDNKKGELVTKQKKPWHISRKIEKMLNDLRDAPDVDLWDRWQNIPAEERVIVEAKIGAMPESSLADIPFEQAVQYSCRDADATLRVYHKLKKMIIDLDLDFVLDMDLKILPMADEMMRNGMAVDLDHFRKLSEDYDVRMRVKSAELAGMVGHPFNPNSRPQVAEVIYKELRFKPTGRTPSGDISTDDQELKKTGHPVAKGVIEYRRLSKMKGTYADNLIQYADSESRVHTTIKTTRTETGRLSSAEPLNFQNIPTRNKEGKAIKNGFVAPDGWVLGEGDLGQIEMCVQADAAKCKGLIDIFLTGQDPHTATASKIFGVSYEDAKQEKYRRPAKCFHPDTEVLTPNGWKKIIDLTIGVDRVMQAVPSDDGSVKLEWVIPTEIFTQKHPSKKLVRLKNHNMDLRVTPDHRMLAWQTKNYRVVNPYELNKQRYWANAGLADGCLEVNETLLRLAVATEADGSYSWRKISFGFYNNNKIKRLRSLVHILSPSSLCESDYPNGKLHPYHSMRIDRGLSDQIKSLLGENKSFPWWWLNLTPKLRLVVLDELVYWDGGRYGDSVGYRYTSGNQQSREVIQAIGAITGRKTRQEHKISRSHGKEYPICNILIRDHALTRGGNLKVTEEDYSGNVACLSVPSSFVLIRSNGIPVIVGQTANFGIIYLVSARGLSEQIKEYVADLEMEGQAVEVEQWTEQQCEKFIADWYRLYPEVKEYQQEQAAHARRYGYVHDMFGRIRYIPEVSCPIRYIQEAGLRMAANMPIQAGAQGIIKMAMGRLWHDLPETCWADSVKFLMQIHDSLIVEMREDDGVYLPYLRWMHDVMCNVVKLLVPVKVDFKVGKAWGSLEKVELEDVSLPRGV